MNLRRIVLGTLASLVLVAALWAMPPASDHSQTAATAQQTPAAQLSVSGKITAVAKESFTLEVAGAAAQHLTQEAPRPKAMTFAKIGRASCREKEQMSGVAH